MKKKHGLYSTIMMAVLAVFLFAACVSSPPLHNAILRGDTQKAEHLVGTDPGAVNAQNSKGETALHLAAIRVQVDVVRALLEAGADPNIADNGGSTPLIEAAYKGDLSMIEMLLLHSAEIDASIENGMTSLSLAVFQNLYPAVKLLLDSGANMELAAKTGMNPLLIAARDGNTAVAELLLSSGADPNAQSQNGMTPLMLSVGAANEYMVRALIARGADPDTKSADEKTAAGMARESGFEDIAELIEDGRQAADTVVESDMPILILSDLKSTLDEEPLSIRSIRALELRTAAGHFLDMMLESGLFERVDTLDDKNRNEKAVFVGLDVQEFQDMHTGGNVSKAFLTGFFTLGLVPPSADYGYSAEVTLFAERSDGQKREYSASSDTTATWSGDPRTAAYSKKGGDSRKTARRMVIHQAFESLVSQLREDGFVSGGE